MDRQRRLSRHRDEGFTMVELVVAMVVIAITLMMLAMVQLTAVESISESGRRQQATALGNEAIEGMRAIPWNVLSKGMASQYLTASGGDSYVNSGNLVVDGKTVPLVVAPSSQNQDLGNPWPPLFSTSGSHKTVRLDAEGQRSYTIRAYVVQGISGSTSSLGLAVIVEWPNSDGGTSHTTVWSSAYRGSGCGNLDTQPYLGACQALFEASSTSGQIVSEVTATTLPNGTDPIFTLPILGPDATNDVYSLTMRTAGVAARASGQQVVVTHGFAQYGGTSFDDADDATQPGNEGWENGFALYELAASDDISSPDYPANPTNLSVTPAGTSEQERYITDSSNSPIEIWAYSDHRRPATIDASVTLGCVTGIPANQPCAKSTMSNYADLSGGSGYVLMEIDNTIFRLSRRLSESGNNNENAWVGRFVTSAGTASAVGCSTLTAEGCISAGAERTMAQLNLGTVVTGSSSWGGQAAQGLVIVEGKSGCPSTVGLYESILVQRGASQKTTTATAVRCGQIRYWNGTAYTTLAIDKNTETTVSTPEVVWTSNQYTVTADATVIVHKAAEVPAGPADCAADACIISADAGVIAIHVTYVITWSGASGQTYVLDSVTVVNPPQATASYKKAPSA